MENKERQETNITKEQALHNIAIYLKSDCKVVPPAWKSTLKLAYLAIELYQPNG